MNFIKVTQDQYNTLKNGGTITKSGVSYSYDSTALYLVESSGTDGVNVKYSRMDMRLSMEIISVEQSNSSYANVSSNYGMMRAGGFYLIIKCRIYGSSWKTAPAVAIRSTDGADKSNIISLYAGVIMTNSNKKERHNSTRNNRKSFVNRYLHRLDLTDEYLSNSAESTIDAVASGSDDSGRPYLEYIIKWSPDSISADQQGSTNYLNIGFAYDTYERPQNCSDGNAFFLMRCRHIHRHFNNIVRLSFSYNDSSDTVSIKNEIINN